jgi:hypothetical protein
LACQYDIFCRFAIFLKQYGRPGDLDWRLLKSMRLRHAPPPPHVRERVVPSLSPGAGTKKGKIDAVRAPATLRSSGGAQTALRRPNTSILVAIATIAFIEERL